MVTFVIFVLCNSVENVNAKPINIHWTKITINNSYSLNLLVGVGHACMAGYSSLWVSTSYCV